MAHTIKGFINTSVDDCKCSLQHCSDIRFLQNLWTECLSIGHLTRAKYVQQRIRQLKETT